MKPIQQALIDYYTEILCHCYEPKDDRLAIGTDEGKLMVLERDDKHEMQFLAETILPGEAAVLGLDWSSSGIFIGTRSFLYLLKPEDIHQQVESGPLPFVKFEATNVLDVCSPDNSNARLVFGASEDSKVRAWDVETQQLISELADQKTPVEVCNANNEYLVTGSADGKIFVYDSDLRTKKPVTSFDIGNHVVCGLDISQNSTWVAAGFKGSPTVYNLRNNAALPEIDVEKPQKIFTVHFDKKNNLWWAGEGNTAYRSDGYTSLSSKLRTSFSSENIYHLYSITSNQKSVSIAGSGLAVLITDNGDYWNELVNL